MKNYEKYLTEENDSIKKVADLLKGDSKMTMMNLRKPLESIFNKKNIDFALSPIAHFRIKDKGKTLIIVNKKYADKAEEIVGEYAIGFEGNI